MEAVRESQSASTKTTEKKKGFLNRWKSSTTITSTATPTSTPITKNDDVRSEIDGKQKDTPTTREGLPIISSATVGENHTFRPSDVRPNTNTTPGTNGVMGGKQSILLEKAPTARDSAFSGPTRYDWIDVETAAAIKIQSIHRRNQATSETATQGYETKFMKKQRLRRSRMTSSSSKFDFCGLGLIFCNGEEQAEQERRAQDKLQYEEKKRMELAKEEKLRSYKPRTKTTTNMQESIELIE